MNGARIFMAMPLLLMACTAYAHQPVMDMAPRWQDGFGLQLRHEAYGSGKLLDGSAAVANPLGLKRYVQKTWLEGVYTFKRSIRATFKLPYIEQRRTRNIDGRTIRQAARGLGDLIIALPLKRYRNQGAFTDNFGFTPALRLPTGSAAGDFPLGDGSLDVGLSLSYSSESPRFYTLIDVFYWLNGRGKKHFHEGDEAGLDINLGLHPLHSNDNNAGLFIMWDFSARHHNRPAAGTNTGAAGGQRLYAGPILVLYKDNFMFRAEYKHPLYEHSSSLANSRGAEFSIAAGLTF